VHRSSRLTCILRIVERAKKPLHFVLFSFLLGVGDNILSINISKLENFDSTKLKHLTFWNGGSILVS